MYVFHIIEFRLSGPLDIMELRHSKLCSRIDFSNPGDLGIIESPISGLLGTTDFRKPGYPWHNFNQIFSKHTSEFLDILAYLKTDILYVLGRIAFRISAHVWKQFLLQGHPKAPILKQYFIPTSGKKCPSAGGFSLPDPPSSQPEKNVVRKT